MKPTICILFLEILTLNLALAGPMSKQDLGTKDTTTQSPFPSTSTTPVVTFPTRDPRGNYVSTTTPAWPFKSPVYSQGTPSGYAPDKKPMASPQLSQNYQGSFPPGYTQEKKPFPQNYKGFPIPSSHSCPPQRDCPPCLCGLRQRSLNPQEDQQGFGQDSLPQSERQRRSLGESDYYHDVGGPDPFLMLNSPSYAAKYNLVNQLDTFGPPLHFGKIDSSDFNYPTDFHLFNTPGRRQEFLFQAGFYSLTGPLRVSLDPTGDLVGPLPDRPDTFTTLILSEGIFRISTVQKNDIFKMQDPITGVVFIVNCLTQPTFASCSNLRKIR